LKLTKLDGDLIAKSIIFQKIYQLPKSRWTALKNRLINIPINDDATPLNKCQEFNRCSIEKKEGIQEFS
jgi:hypothetical protein